MFAILNHKTLRILGNDGAKFCISVQPEKLGIKHKTKFHS